MKWIATVSRCYQLMHKAIKYYVAIKPKSEKYSSNRYSNLSRITHIIVLPPEFYCTIRILGVYFIYEIVRYAYNINGHAHTLLYI